MALTSEQRQQIETYKTKKPQLWQKVLSSLRGTTHTQRGINEFTQQHGRYEHDVNDEQAKQALQAMQLVTELMDSGMSFRDIANIMGWPTDAQ